MLAYSPMLGSIKELGNSDPRFRLKSTQEDERRLPKGLFRQPEDEKSLFVGGTGLTAPKDLTIWIFSALIEIPCQRQIKSY